MRKGIVLLIAVALLSCGAQAEELTSVLDRGHEAYKSEGREAFVKALTEGGPLEGDQDALSQVNMLTSIEGYYGAYQGFDVIREMSVGERTTIIYLVMNYESGPLFGRATQYRSGNAGYFVGFWFNTEPQQVWPDTLLLSDK